MNAPASRFRRPLNERNHIRNIILRSANAKNNAESKFSFNEMNTKDLPAMYSTVFWCLLLSS